MTTQIPRSPEVPLELQSSVTLMPWDKLRGAEGYMSVDEAAKSMAECGLDVAGFVKPEYLDVCKKHGLGAIVSDAPSAAPPSTSLCPARYFVVL